MTITTNLTDGNIVTETKVEIEKDVISISLVKTSACINIVTEVGKITAFIYSDSTTDAEVITLSK